MKNDCPPCQAVSGFDSSPLALIKTEDWCLVMASSGYNAGQIDIISRIHTPDLAGLTPQAKDRVFGLAQSCIEALSKVSSPKGYNVGLNLGAAAGGSGAHEHICVHVVPRWPSDSGLMLPGAGVQTMGLELDKLATKTKKGVEHMSQLLRFKLTKLVRDKNPQLMESRGAQVAARTMDTEEFIKELKAKLLEEADEVTGSTNKDELIEELADIMEVVTALAKASDISQEQISIAQATKREKRGGFENRVYAEYIDAPESSSLAEYCSALPDKYPQLEKRS